VVFDAARTTSFVIRARARCRDATYTWESSMPVPEEIAIEVPSGPVPVPVSSAPPGAAIFVDGKDAGLVTPADVPLDPCGTQSVTLRLAAYREWSYLPGSPPATDWSASLRDVALEALPPGILVLQRAPYSVDVFEGRGRVARFTTQGGRVNLAPGRHSLQVRNAERMVSVPVTVDVASGDTARLDVPWPPLSTIRIIAVPGNCTAEVVGDGGATRDLGPTPTEATLGPGTYTVRVRYVATGELQTKRIQLAGGANPAPLRFVFQP